MSQIFDGLLSFYSSHYAIRANSLLKRADMASELIPGPKEISPNCGVALRISYDQHEVVLSLLNEKNVQIDSVHRYQPTTDRWNDGK